MLCKEKNYFLFFSKLPHVRLAVITKTGRYPVELSQLADDLHGQGWKERCEKIVYLCNLTNIHFYEH